LTDEKDESAVFGGHLRWNGTQLEVERNNEVPFKIREEWIERIRLVENDEVRNILLGADYYLRLAIGPRPDGEGFVTTGLSNSIDKPNLGAHAPETKTCCFLAS
jgi:hypothetical protein